MDALTPARPALRPSPGMNTGSWHEQVSLIHAPGLPTIPSPTTCGRSASSGHVTPRRVEPRSLPHGSSPNGNSGLRHSLAGSPRHTGRIEFLIVRTGRSPPAAPHPVSPRRSCRRLQVTLTWRGLSPLQPGALSGALAAALRRHVASRRHLAIPLGAGSPLQHQIDLDASNISLDKTALQNISLSGKESARCLAGKVCVEGSRGPVGFSAFSVLGRADAAATEKTS